MIPRMSSTDSQDELNLLHLLQMHVRHLADPAAAKAALEAAFPAFTAMAHEIQPNLVRRGGGIRGWEAKVPLASEKGVNKPVEATFWP